MQEVKESIIILVVLLMARFQKWKQKGREFISPLMATCMIRGTTQGQQFYCIGAKFY